MNRIQQQINDKVQDKLRDKLQDNLKETPAEWYERGVKENMKFLDWLLPLTK